jgi:hypothetical protein
MDKVQETSGSQIYIYVDLHDIHTHAKSYRGPSGCFKIQTKCTEFSGVSGKRNWDLERLHKEMKFRKRENNFLDNSLL